MDDLSRLLSFLGAGGATCAAKAAFVLAGTGLMAWLLRRRAAATRHLVWCLGLAGSLAVLPMAWVLPGWGVPILSKSAEPSPANPAPVADSRPAALPTAEPATLEPQAIAGPIIPPPQSSIEAPVVATRPGSWWLTVWLAGSLVVLAWSAIGWWTIWRLGRGARRISDRSWIESTDEAAARLGLAQPVTLLRGGPLAMPVTWGVLRPMILLPAEADSWSADRRRTVLLHELAHVRRRDCLTQWLGLAACAAYWFNPMAWWAAGRLMTEREQACDDLVLEAGERPSDYATELLLVARLLRPSPALSHAAMAMARPSGLERRLLAILDAHRDRRGPARRMVAGCLTVVLGASGALAAIRPVVRDTPGTVVTGRVVGTDGKPVEGASLVVLAPDLVPRAPRLPDPPARVLGRAQTDAQGAFRLEVAAQSDALDERSLLVATAPGLGFAARRLGDPTGPIGDPLRLSLERPVEVKLVDLQGSPIVGAEARVVLAYPESAGEGLDSNILLSQALPALAIERPSDDQGRITLRGISPDHSVTLEVKAARFGKQRLRLQTKAETRTATLALPLAQVIEGRVTLGKDGPPASGAEVRAQSMSMKEGIGMNQGNAETTTGPDGRYRLEAAPGGSVRLEVYPPRMGADAYLMRGILLVPTDEVAMRSDVVLPRGVLVRGRVTEAKTGKPIAGAVVSHKAYERNNPYFIKGSAAYLNGDEQNAISAADGTYRLAVMPGPGYLLTRGPTDNFLHDEISTVELNGQLIWPNTRNYPDAFRKLNPKPEDGPITVDLALRPGTKVSGQVAQVDGEPARDAVLFSRWALGTSKMTVNYGQSLQPVRGGQFELGGCDPDSSAPVFFLDAGRQQGAVVELSGKQAGQDLKVALQPCGSATVRFVDDQGKSWRPGRAPAHLEVVLTPGASFGDLSFGAKAQNESPLMADSIHVANLDRERYRGLKVDSEGRMHFPTLIPGATYRVIVYNQPVKTQIEFTVKPGETKDLGDLKILNIEGAG